MLRSDGLATRHDYEKETKLCLEFLTGFEDPGLPADPTHGKKKYKIALQRAVDREASSVEVSFEDVALFFSKQEYAPFVEAVRRNAKRYMKLFTDAADLLEVERRSPRSETEEFDEELNSFRLANLDKKEGPKPPEQIVHMLKRKFELVLVLADLAPGAKRAVTPLRSLKASLIGSLVNVRAMVVRVTEVKPLIKVACYICEACGCEIYQLVNRRVYTPSLDCPSNICSTNNSKGRVVPNFAVSKFVPYQELKVQETSDQTPMGSIPRTFTVQCSGALTRQCSPGDIVLVAGVYLPKVNESQAPGGDRLTHDTYIEACRIEQEKKKYCELYLSDETVAKLQEESLREGTYHKLASSICPEIFGLEHVKKALLLQMVAGSTLRMHDGMRIRGDVNVALIGDPGVAKSQLLKQIAHLTPRGVYTSGKGSSGAGLTAAVIRDEFTREVMLEGGALVLADMGICCIDEFDKMEDKDRTSIHEVMEQQTVSIAKAGITTSLNARTSILAAANPVYGRYNRAKTPHENINLPPSLLSRFDLIFILLDRPNDDLDFRMASHITYVHQNLAHPQADKDLYSTEFLRAYIAYAKKFNPTIAPELHPHLVTKYVDKRQKLDKDQAKTTYSYTTPRTLLAVIRLSQALAKLRFSDQVTKEDIEEALYLMEESQRSVIEQTDDGNVFRQNAKKDPVSQIYNMIRADAELRADKGYKATNYSRFEKKIITKGYSVADLQKCIKNYSELDILMFNEPDDDIVIISG